MNNQKKPKNFNVPNVLTMLRIFIIPIIMVMLTHVGFWINLFTGILFLIASLTDIVDGYIARKYNMITNLGKILDPLADKLLVLTALIMLIPLDRVPAWMVAVIVLRETGVTSLRAVAAADGTVIAASFLGKYKNMFQVIATLFLIVHHNYQVIRVNDFPISFNFHAAGILVMWVALIFTFWSGVDYFFKLYHLSDDKSVN